MIAHLQGTVFEKRPGQVVIDVGGVGYDVTVPISTYASLPATGAQVQLLIHTHVREDALALFGFLTQEEKTLFEKLIDVSGIGPKLAVTVLSGLPTPDLIASIRHGQVEQLVRIPGVGKKTAERMLKEAVAPLARNPALREEIQALRDEAVKLYLRAKGYCMRAMEVQFPGIGKALDSDPVAALKRAKKKEDVPLLYWTAASWGAALLYFTGSKEHNVRLRGYALRKKLLLECNLHTVLDCPGGTFLGAAVKPVVLFFEKGSPTKKVWFYQLDPGRSLGKTVLK